MHTCGLSTSFNKGSWDSIFHSLVLISLLAYVSATCNLTGVNLSGAEFGGAIPGTPFSSYVWNGPKDAAYFYGKGMNFYRIPFLWERMQTIAGGDLEPGYLNGLITIVNDITITNQKYALIDPHNYGSGFGGKIGQSATSICLYADLWYKLALVFKNNSRVVFGLMNEPNNQDVHIWKNAAQRAIDAIRYTGATNLITVPGVDWTGAHSWANNNAAVMWDINDPIDNYIYEIHQYLDFDSSGTHNICVSATVGVQALQFFTAWAKNISKKAILGEFGGAGNELCGEALTNMLGFMDQNTDVYLGWTYWSGGPWWGDWYFSNLTPNSTGEDRPQMHWLEPHISPNTPSPSSFKSPTGSYTPPSSFMKSQSVYANGQLQNPYADYSWAHHDLCNTSVARSGESCSISFDLSKYGALWIECNQCLNSSLWFSLSFWFNPGSTGSPNFGFYLVNSTGNTKVSSSTGLDIGAYASGPISPNQWVQISLPLGWFPADLYNGFQIQGNEAGAVPEMYISDISLVAYPDNYSVKDQSRDHKKVQISN